MADKRKEKIFQWINELNESELQDFEFIIEGLNQRKQRKSGSYIGALLHAESEFKDDIFTIRIPNSALIQNSLNIVHGGITATLLDSAMGSLAFQYLPSDYAAVTTEMKINYVAPGIGKELVCNASLIHKGTKTIVTEGKVFRDDGQLIAHSTASFFIIKRRA
ncbi:PaaI family thioesterase [Metabacillus arenae]|uniref:PaaI family thioesterase n=1 Tax=Metabacillus arenae TaxID=2771434 RepID=A0A926RWM5_9BACI|nr:PaaI family thioesterase [Metabacillus arenae]MBD1380958.1 PaaI family thioesterase [Metabacillus arenae]